MTVVSLKKSFAVSVAAAFLITGPGLPIAQSAAENVAARGAHASAPALVAAPSLQIAAPGLSTINEAAAPFGAAAVPTLQSAAAAPAAAQPAGAQAAQIVAGLAESADLKTATSQSPDVSDADRMAAMTNAFDVGRRGVSFSAGDFLPAAMTGLLASRLGRPSSRSTAAGPRDAVVAASAKAALGGSRVIAPLAGAAAFLTATGAMAANQFDRWGNSVAPEPTMTEWVLSYVNTAVPFAALALAAMGLVSITRAMLFQVPQGYIYVMNTMGKHSGIKLPGLNTKIPGLQTIRARLSIQDQTMPLEFNAITSDQATVTYKGTLTYAIKDHEEATIKKAAYTFVDQQAFLTALKRNVEGVIRSYVADKKQNQVAGLRNEIFEEVNKHLEATVAEWGYAIRNVQMETPTFDSEIDDAMRDVVTSQQELTAAVTNAKTNLDQAVREAEADRDSEITTAKSEAAATILEGKGVAQFTEEATQGLKGAVGAGLSERFVAFMMHLENMRKMAKEGRGNAMLVNGSPAAMAATQQQIDELLAKSAATRTGDQGKDKSGSSVKIEEQGNRSGAAGFWLLGAASALFAYSAMGVGAVPYVAAAALAAFMLRSVLFVVPEGYVYTVTQFTKFKSVKKPGLNWKIPFIQAIDRKISVQNRTLEYPKFTAISDDKANVHFNATLIYRVKDSSDKAIETVAYKFIDKDSFMAQLKTRVENSVGTFINTKKQSQVLGLRNEIVKEVKSHLDHDMAVLGYELLDVQINDVTFDPGMMKAMTAVVTAENRQLATKNRAEATYVTKTKAAEARGKGIEIRADGKREAQRQRGIGVRGFREETGKGVKKAIEETGLSEGFVSLMMSQDAMRDIAAGGKGNVIDMQEPDGAKGDPGVKKMMNLDLGRRAAAAEDNKDKK